MIKETHITNDNVIRDMYSEYDHFKPCRVADDDTVPEYLADNIIIISHSIKFLVYTAVACIPLIWHHK